MKRDLPESGSIVGHGEIAAATPSPPLYYPFTIYVKIVLTHPLSINNYMP